MPRKPAVESPPPQPPAPIVISPDAVFTTDAVRTLLGLKQSSLRREIRQGRLQVSKRCGRYFFLGSQLLQWLRAGEVPRA
jgi:hypothetical protein